MQLLKAPAFLFLPLAGLFLAGCNSGPILVSQKATAMPATNAPLTAIRYYLPTGKVEVSAKWDQLIPGWDPQFKVSAQADPNSCYSIDRDINSHYDDDVSISVDPTTGLLASVNATTTDQTVNAIGNIAATASSFASFGTSFGSAIGEKSRDESAYSDVVRNAFTSQFDVQVTPSHPHAVAYVVSPAPDLGRPTTANPSAPASGKSIPANTPATTPTTPPAPASATAPAAPPPASSKLLYAKFTVTLQPANPDDSAPHEPPAAGTALDGIAIRIPVPYNLIITVSYFREGDTTPRPLSTTENVILPDQDHDYFLPLDRIPLVTSSTKVVLVNGMVQSLQRSRPSTFAAIVGVPKTLLTDLIPLPLAVHQSVTTNVQASGHGSN